MKTNSPDHRKSNSPDSDETARKQTSFAGEEMMDDVSAEIEGLQTSNKSGKHSSVEKLAASRPELGSGRGALPVDGAFGDADEHPVTGRNAGPGTNQFRCSGCGRYFNTAGELAAHEPECRSRKRPPQQVVKASGTRMQLSICPMTLNQKNTNFSMVRRCRLTR